MGRTLGGVVLLLVSAFMLIGFIRSGATIGGAHTIVALLVAVVVPAAGGVALLRAANRRERRGGARVAQLRQATIESEILRLAMLRSGRLTAAEVASTLALTPEEATAALDGMVKREVAGLDAAGSGEPAYTFHEVKHAAGRIPARGLLDS